MLNVYTGHVEYEDSVILEKKKIYKSSSAKFCNQKYMQPAFE